VAHGPVDPKGEALLELLGRSTRRLADDLQMRMAAAGFTNLRPAHHQVLAHVPPEGIRLTALAERARITKQAMAELVGDLVRLGYLRRATDPDDRRAKRIELTDRGAKSAAAARRALAAIETELGERITPKRLRQLRRALLGALDGVAPG
jgi:DNA-binding MarR family transcriptional regulator